MAGDRRLSRPDSSLPDWEMPDTAYRPIPIVWFTGAFFIHLLAMMGIFLALAILGMSTPWLTVPACALAAGLVGKWTWERGMADAGLGWRIATILILLFNLLFALASSF